MLCAQSNYEHGYIITNQQDTISGWINLRTNKNNQKRCEFKTDLKLAAKIYLPEDIAGYRFTKSGKYYVSREIRLNETPQRVFVEFLVKGIMNLYYYEDDINYYLFENQDGKMEVISQKPERIENMIAHKDYEYTGKIRYLFRDYQPIVQMADKLAFDQKSMMGVVEEYHNEVCTTGESCIIFKNEHPDDIGLRTKISVYAGLLLSNNYNHAVRSGNNVSPVLGVQVNFINPRWSKSFGLQLDASLSQFTGEYDKRYANMDAPSYKSLAPSIRLGVQYIYPKYKIFPIAEAGIACTYLKEIKGIGTLQQFLYYGYYLAAGAGYKIKTSHALFVKLVYEDYPYSMWVSRQQVRSVGGNYKINLLQIKAGYTF